MAARRGIRQRAVREASDGSARTWLPAGLIVVLLAGVLAYANAWTGPFVFDDRATILDNTTIRDGTDLARVFSPPKETPVAGRPLANLTFAINYAIADFDVTGYHAVNIALHLACGALVFLVIRRTWSSGPALASALIWIVHPLGSEVVNYTSQRTESLMACAMLATLYASVRALEPARRMAWSLMAIGACAAGMASKETMVVAPLLVLLYDRTFAFDSIGAALRARWPLYAGLAATWSILIALLLTGPRTQSAGFSAPDAAPLVYLFNQTRLIVHYLRLAVWPDALVLFYGPPEPLTFRDVWPYAVAVLSIGAFTIWAWARRPRAGFLGAWFFLTLAPASSFVPIATEVGAERRMYLPLLALVVAAVAAVLAITRRGAWPEGATRRAATGLVAVVSIALGARTLARNADYKSSLRLAETTAAGWPTPAADSMLGTELAAAGRLSEAEAALRRAAVAYEPARYYLATVLAAEGQTDSAIAAFEAYLGTSLQSLAEVRKAREMLADLYARRGRWAGAATQYQLILERDPNDAATHGRLADALMSSADYVQAIPHYQALLAARPTDARALGGLGIAYAQTGRVDDAIAAFQRAVDADPRSAHAEQNLARALLTAGRRDEARAHAERAAALNPADPATRDLLERIR